MFLCLNRWDILSIDHWFWVIACSAYLITINKRHGQTDGRHAIARPRFAI